MAGTSRHRNPVRCTRGPGEDGFAPVPELAVAALVHPRTFRVRGRDDRAVTGRDPARGRLDSVRLFWQIRGPQTLTLGPTGLPET